MKTILIAEDSPDLRLLYRLELEEEGYRVIEMESAQKFLDYMEKREPVDLIILDIRMEETMTGLDALSLLMEKEKKIPVIINTAYAEYKENLISWLADAYLVKSSDLSILKAKIREILN